jgi:hypothetical protein
MAWFDLYQPTTTSFPTAFLEGLATDSRRNIYTSVHVDASNRIDIIKYTDAAEDLWASTYPRVSGYTVSANANYKTEIAADDDESLYVTGVFNGTIQFLNQGTSATGAPDLTASGSDDIFLAKLDDAGAWQWSFRVGGAMGSNNERLPAIASDCCGNVYLSGQYSSSILQFYDNSGSTGLNLTKQGATSFSEVFMVKVNGNGKAVWSLQGYANQTIDTTAIAIDGNKNIYFAARIASNVTGNIIFKGSFGDTSATKVKMSGTADDLILLKYDRNGKNVWAVQMGDFGGSAGTFSSIHLDVDDCSNVYLTAVYTHDNLSFGDMKNNFNSAFDITQDVNNAANAFLIKYNGDGKPQWVTKTATTNALSSLSNVRVTVDNCGQAFWVGEVDDRSIVFYDFGQGNGGTSNPVMNVMRNRKLTFGFKVSEEGMGMYSWRLGTSNFALTQSPRIVANNCDDVYVVANVFNDDAAASQLQFFNPGEADTGGTPFSLFTTSFPANTSARLIVKLANETRSAAIIGNIQEVITPTLVKVTFAGGINLPNNTLSLNKTYYLDTDSGSLTNLSANNGCRNRFVGTACDLNELLLVGDEPLCKDPLCINPDFTLELRPVRYLVSEFTNTMADNGSIVARSFVKNAISATRTGPSTIINFNGYVYNITIPSGDDIQHISIFDKHGGSGQVSTRVKFTWIDSDFVGNISTTNIKPVAPNITVGVYVDNTGVPVVSAGNGTIRYSGISSNEFQMYGYTGKSITVDIQLQDGISTWYCLNFSF